VALCEEKRGDEISRWAMVTPLIEHHTKTRRDGEMKDSRSGKNVLLVFESLLTDCFPSMHRTRVKICGLTRESDLAAAVAAGADAIGFVFYARSPRAVAAEQARMLVAALPPFVTSVGLFVDAEPDLVRSVLARVPLAMLQFHGDEPSAYCDAFHRPWIKAVCMRPETDLRALVRRYRDARGLLLDTYDPAVSGGTGRRFDWDLIPGWLAPRIILAGGLNPDNVAEAIRRVGPCALDVSGGVESAKGIKDHAKMEAFLQGVRDGDDDRSHHKLHSNI